MFGVLTLEHHRSMDRLGSLPYLSRPHVAMVISRVDLDRGKAGWPRIREADKDQSQGQRRAEGVSEPWVTSEDTPLQPSPSARGAESEPEEHRFEASAIPEKDTSPVLMELTVLSKYFLKDVLEDLRIMLE